MTIRNVFSKSALLGAALALWPSIASAQGFTKADSGWTPLFNGTDFTGLYSRMYNEAASDNVNPVFKVQDGTIKVAVGGGHLGTKKKFSHYRMRVEYRFDADNLAHNAGLMYHVDESVARMSNKWSRSIECQMKQSETGSVFSIQQATFTTTVTAKTNFAPYKFGGEVVNVCQNGCDGRNYKANPVIPGGAHWMRMEVVVRGSDSGIHIINDQVVLKLWNIRIFNASDTPNGPYGSGGIALQAEGAGLAYRNWEVMELPVDGPHFLNRLFVTAPDGGQRLTVNATYNVTWRTLGSIPKVNLEYSTGAGWKPLATDVDNTGSYAWKVPNEVTEKLRVRVAGPSWARADTSAADNAIQVSSGILGAARFKAGPESQARAFDLGGRRLGPEAGRPFGWFYYRKF